jgi:hypothetical protein
VWALPSAVVELAGNFDPHVALGAVLLADRAARRGHLGVPHAAPAAARGAAGDLRWEAAARRVAKLPEVTKAVQPVPFGAVVQQVLPGALWGASEQQAVMSLGVVRAARRAAVPGAPEAALIAVR